MMPLSRTIAVLLIPIALAGCQAVTERQQLALLDGERAFISGDYGTATQQMSAFLAEVQGRPESARALYVRGMANALTGHRINAYADLQAATQLTASPDLSWQPSAALGILYFEDEKWEAALPLFTTATQRMPASPPMDALLFRIGLCNERSGRWSAALPAFRRILSDFPRGPYVEPARRRLQLNADHFAVQCGVFAQSENAQQLVADLRKRGLQPYVHTEQRGGTTCLVVLEGRYQTYAEAIQGLARVRGYVAEAILWP